LLLFHKNTATTENNSYNRTFLGTSFALISSLLSHFRWLSEISKNPEIQDGGNKGAVWILTYLPRDKWPLLHVSSLKVDFIGRILFTFQVLYC